jgi:hypothetical protein
MPHLSRFATKMGHPVLLSRLRVDCSWSDDSDVVDAGDQGKGVPQRLKPLFCCDVCGTAKAVPLTERRSW